MSTRFFIVCAATFALAGATALAQQAFVPPPSGIRAVERLLPEGTRRDTKIIGTVMDIRQTRVKYAHVQLRNLVSGLVFGEVTANDNGEYEFAVIEPSTYVVEMMLADGNIVALSNAASISRYETVRTVVQVPGRWDFISQRVMFDQNVATYLGVSGQVTMTAQTLELAVQQNITAREAGEPVSP